MATPIQINPIDFDIDVAVGVDLPMIDGSGTRFKLNYTSLDQTSANARNLLLTNKGERVMLPDFGCDLYKILFDNLSPNLVSKAEASIQESFSKWLPHVEIHQLQLTPNYDSNQLNLKMAIGLRGNRFDTRSIELTLSTNG